MEESEQLPLKRVELSLSKFNDVAIPHHLDLLRQHKQNIIKHAAEGRWRGVRAEQARAGRAAGRLRALLAELAALRDRVAPADRRRFDAATQRARAATLRAVQDYLETCPVAVSRSEGDDAVAGSVASTDSVGVLRHADADADADEDTLHGLQLQVDDQEAALREREAVLVGWTELQAEVRALHGAWQTVQAAALAQRDTVSATAAHVEAADANVAEGAKSLAAADRVRGAAAWGACGAALGALAGGPVGLVAGAKAGAAAALAGSAAALLAHRLWTKNKDPPPPPPPDPHPKRH